VDPDPHWSGSTSKWKEGSRSRSASNCLEHWRSRFGEKWVVGSGSASKLCGSATLIFNSFLEERNIENHREIFYFSIIILTDQLFGHLGRLFHGIMQHTCCGSGMFIPDPDFYPSRVPDPKTTTEEGREI
jgi:hypothetical protein